MAIPFPIDYTKSFIKLSAVIKAHNDKTPHLSDRLRQPVLATAKELIRIYGSALLKARDFSGLEVDDLPSLRTNNVQLSKLLVCSPRTIQRHISKLIQTGVLTRKKWHGSNSSYELWFDINVLSINGVQAVKNLKNSSNDQKIKLIDNQFFKNSKTTSCRHTDTGYNPRNINNILIGVQKNMDSLSLKPKINTGNTSGHTREKVSKKIITREKVQKRDTRQAGAEKLSQDLMSRSTFLNSYVDELWSRAQKMLYDDVYLLNYQIRQGKEMLLKWYEPVHFSKLTKAHRIYNERLVLAQKYVAKDPLRRYIPPPYLYFDPQNKNGFAGTRIWWQTDKKQKYQTRLKLIVHAQIRRFKKNECSTTEKQKPRLELFRQCELRISKLGDPELLQRFYKAVLTANTYEFMDQKTQ